MPRRRSRSPAVSPPATERVHPRSEDLDVRPVRDVIQRLHDADRQAVHSVGLVLDQVTALAERAIGVLKDGGSVIYVGAGSSGRIGNLDASEIPPTYGASPKTFRAVIAGGAPALQRAIEGAEDNERAGAHAMRREVDAGDLVIGISASATTPFVRGALRQARKLGAHTALVTCNPSSAELSLADLFVLPDTGPEVVAGSTRLKAGTATKLVLNAVSTASMVALGKVYRGRMIDLKVTNEKLRTRALRIVRELSGLPETNAKKLLKAAGGSPKVALAMHFARLSRREAEKRLEEKTLREIAGP